MNERAMHGHLAPVDTADLHEYPLSRDMRLDSHWFMAWERRRWLNSDMRLKGRPECRALYFDLICISYEQTPMGTLPDDPEILAKLLFVPEAEFKALCKMPYGPLHRWDRCTSEGEVRLYHPMVLQTLNEAIARAEDNRSRSEAGNARQRQFRLRSKVAGYHPELAKNDAAILWMDEWLEKQGCGYRSATWIERCVRAWSEHTLFLSRN